MKRISSFLRELIIQEIGEGRRDLITNTHVFAICVMRDRGVNFDDEAAVGDYQDIIDAIVARSLDAPADLLELVAKPLVYRSILRRATEIGNYPEDDEVLSQLQSGAMMIRDTLIQAPHVLVA